MIANLDELYGFARHYRAELTASGDVKLADDVDRALTGGTTSGEILMNLALALDSARESGLGNERVNDALDFMTRVAEESRRQSR